MSKSTRYIWLALAIIALILVRFYEGDLFYDPYLQFFRNDYLYIDSPRREVFKLSLFTSLRYLINSVISIWILYLVFRDKGILKFSAIIFGIAYVILLFAFLYFVIDPRQEDYYLFFNVRRFLIQPLIIIILLPAFYYHKLKQ